MSDKISAPPEPGVDTDFTLGTLFGPLNPFDLAKEEKEKKEKAAAPAAVAYDCHAQTFVLWRPPEVCTYCTSSTSNFKLAEGENLTVCPHIQNQEYQDIVNSVFLKKTILHFEEFFMLPNGTRCVQLVWLTVKKVKKPKDKPVYPPNPAKVFDQKDEEPKDKGV